MDKGLVLEIKQEKKSHFSLSGTHHVRKRGAKSQRKCGEPIELGNQSDEFYYTLLL